MDPDEAIAYLDYLTKRKEEDMLFQRWISGPQFSMSFERFKEELKPVPIKKDEEILDDVFKILEMFSGGNNGNI